MRIRLDVMPAERKVIPRDYFAFIFFIALLFQVLVFFFVSKASHSEKIATLTKKDNELNVQLSVVVNEKNVINTQLSQLSTLKKKVDYIERSMAEKKCSWFSFFQYLEEAVTLNIWIKDITQDEKGRFCLVGQAKDAFCVTKFLKNMIENPFFYEEHLAETKILDEKEEPLEFILYFKAGGKG